MKNIWCDVNLKIFRKKYQKFTDRLRKENVFSNVWGKYLQFAKELDLFIKFNIVLFSAETSENINQLKNFKK